MATVADWIEGARPRTLPAAIAPVLLGSGAAAQIGGFHLGRALLAAGVALALQVGVNYANDYSDGIRGTDEVRTGPPRLTGGGLTSPATVKRAAFACFALAGVLGLALVVTSGQWLFLLFGALAVLAAWYYTGGSRPYGYMGLGEVFVFVFFGLLATVGTTWTQAGTAPWTAWVGAVGIGLIACALLMVNNIRDIPTDSQVGKHTLAVRLGERRARLAFAAMVLVPLALAAVCALATWWALLTLVLVPWGWLIARHVLSCAQGRELIAALGATGKYELLYGALLGIGLASPLF